MFSTGRYGKGSKLTSLIRVVLTGVHPPIVTALRQMLEFERELNVVAQAYAKNEVVKLLTKHQPDILILHLESPGANPEEVVACLEALSRIESALVLSAHTTFHYPPETPPFNLAEPLRIESDDFTAREQEVLLCMARGYDNQEIAQMLCITTDTVKFHVKNLYRKLGVSSRAKVVAWFWQHRMIWKNANSTPEGG